MTSLTTKPDVAIAADADGTVFHCRAELIVGRHQFERAFERAFHTATVFSSIQSAIAGNRSLRTRRSAMASMTGQKPTLLSRNWRSLKMGL
jgi:hypothetical protein